MSLVTHFELLVLKEVTLLLLCKVLLRFIVYTVLFMAQIDEFCDTSKLKYLKRIINLSSSILMIIQIFLTILWVLNGLIFIIMGCLRTFEDRKGHLNILKHHNLIQNLQNILKNKIVKFWMYLNVLVYI